ncbi:extracellular solute-binding protein [Nocardioides exalbidus]|uniref:Extracellular solute-binding protein n=1 Tax=Nocardioides exalbidus TaxID=402596 RepID=A0A1H4TNL5_9ACTN|nr:VWA domain-containing protein [Nocardioides exalbidus]SEC57997.1 extracellular solute-binding protein [Nocardioides exalbidus]
MDVQDEPARSASSLPTPVLVVLLLVAGLVAGGGTAWVVLGGGSSASAGSEACGSYRSLDVTIAPELYSAVVDALDSVTPPCTRVTPTSRGGMEVAEGVALGGRLPDLWIPEAGFLTKKAYVGAAARVRVVAPSLASTPVVLVGGASARRFRSWGDAEASGLVTSPDPESSAVGALALVAPLAEAPSLGRTPARARELLVPFAQGAGARRADGADATVAPSMFSKASPRLVVTTEHELADAPARTDLRDLTPAVGSPVLDFPLVLSVDAAPGSQAVAQALVDHLTGPEGRAALADEGLGSGVGDAGLRTPPAPAIAQAVRSWRTLAVPSSILAVVDASGSMDATAGSGSRMELLADAAGIGLSFLPGHARVGLWVFSIDKGGPGKDWRRLEPLRRLDDLRFGRTQRYALRERAAQLPALTGGGTGLYDTALAAYRSALRSYRPEYSNAVVLMTDGRNEDPGSIQLPALLDRLRELRDPDRPVRVVGIAISGDADLDALQQIAHVTGGEAYLAAQPEDVLGVFAQAVLSR